MQKREVILNAALELFLEQGYERTSLKQIVARTGGSLATVYKHFGNKSRLFFEAIRHRHESNTAELLALLDINKNLPLKEFLQLFGRKHLAHFASSDNIAMLRLLISAIYSDEQIAERIQREHERILVNYLSEIFEQKLEFCPAQIPTPSENPIFSQKTPAPSESLLCAAKTPAEFFRQLAEFYLALLHSAEFAAVLFFAPKFSDEQIAAHSQKVCEFFLFNAAVKEV